MNPSNPTGQTAQTSSAPSNQGSTPTNVNPFEASPTPEPTGSQPAEPQGQTQTQGQEPVTQPDGQQPAATQEGQLTQGQQAQQPATPPAFDPQQITKAIVDGIVTAQTKTQQAAPQQQTQQPKPMSPEEFRRHYEIPQIDAATYEAILGTTPDKPERVAALDNVLTGYMRAGIKMGQDLMQARLQQLEQQFESRLGPVFQAHQQQQEQAVISRFTTTFPDLANEMALVNDVKDAMIARGMKFGSEQEMFQAVGAATRQLITRLRGAPAGGNQTQPGGSQPGGGTQKPPARTMTPSMQGGRGGSAAPKQSTSTAELVFGS